jgi:hypothetical protein
VARSDRHQEVRSAARGWQRAGAIPEATRVAIDAAYPDDRARLGPVFRVLVFAFTFLIANAVFGLVAVVLSRAFNRSGGVLLVMFGLLFLGATEFQIGTLRRREGGTEAATGFLALVYLTLGLVWIASDSIHGSDGIANFALAVMVLLFALAGLWWGYELFVAVAGVAAFALVARGPFGRLWWMVLPLVLAPVLVRASEVVALAPAHRRSCQVLTAIALVFLYLAVHLGSWDAGLVETIRTARHWGSADNSSVRPFFIVTTALVPFFVLAWGMISRRRMLLNLGLVGLLASLATLRQYVHVAPAWVVLLAGGGATVGLALALRRFLHAGVAHERHGFTAEPLFSDPERRHALEVVAGLVSLAPDARPVDVDKADFKGGGGRSGGAGASGAF